MFYIFVLIGLVSALFFWRLDKWLDKRFASGVDSQKVLVGFWLRLISDFLDVVVLGIFGSMLAFLRPVFEAVGERGWWIGLLVTFLYTGISQSSFGSGQSLAKKFLGIQVIKRDGSFMTLPESFLRYLVLALIAYGGWIENGLVASFPVLANQTFTVIFSIIYAICFVGVILLIPFHPLKQGLHDLIVNTVVVRKGSFSPEKIDSLRDPQKEIRAYTIAGVAVVLIVIAFESVRLSWQNSAFSTDIPKLSQISHQIEEVTSFQNVSVGFKF